MDNNSLTNAEVQTLAAKRQRFLRQRELERRLRTMGFKVDFAMTDLAIAAAVTTHAMRAFTAAFSHPQ